MKKAKIPVSLRELVIERAHNRCEYCLIPSDLAFYKLEIDHITPEKQNGPTVSENLALACKPCNCNKGYSVVRYYYESGKTVALFNPRKQEWADNFSLLPTGEIIGLTDIDTATAEVLNFNLVPRVEFRERMLSNGILTI